MRLTGFVLRWLWIVSVTITLIYIVLKFNLGPSQSVTLSVSTLSDGEYRKFMTELETYLDESDTFLKILKKIDTNGSVDTIRQLNLNKVDVGLVQANTSENAKNVACVAPVFDEVFFFLSRKDRAPVSMYELKGNANKPFTVATLKEGSQTYKDLQSLLGFYDYELGKDYQVIEGSYREGLNRLLQAKEGVDYAFFVSGLGNTNFNENIDWVNAISPISLDNRSAYLKRHPNLSEFNIPKGMYGREFEAYETISTSALLVSRSNLPEAVVYELSRLLYEGRYQLQSRFEFYNMQLDQGFGCKAFSRHPGSTAYINRNQPSSVEMLADRLQPITQYLIWILVGAFNVISIFFGIKNRKRNTK